MEPVPWPLSPAVRRSWTAGACLYLLTEPDEVESILAVLRSEGLFLRTFVDTQEEADGLVKKAKRWSARGNQCVRAEVPGIL